MSPASNSSMTSRTGLHSLLLTASTYTFDKKIQEEFQQDEKYLWKKNLVQKQGANVQNVS